ncbi:MAG: cysteine--tRNA ligase, partial [Treponema sp.]|nr:cysteine--tRNA ligase [Treponema sp.]
NEIAQSEGATSKKWVNYWLHNEFLVIAKPKASEDPSSGEVEAAKMSKSSGNFLRLQSLIDKGYSPLDYRFFLLGGHYRKQLYFSFDAMESAKNARGALVNRVAKLAKQAGGSMGEDACKNACQNACQKDYAKGEAASLEGLSSSAVELLTKFKEDLENDLGTPAALSRVQKAVKDSSLNPSEALELVGRMDSVLGLGLLKSANEALQSQNAASLSTGASSASSPSHEGDSEAAEIDALVAARVQAKKDKNFAEADRIRDELTARGIVVTDTPNGPVWERKK